MRVFFLILIGSVAGFVAAQDREQVEFYYNNQIHEIEVLPYSRPPYVDLDGLLRAMGSEPLVREDNLVVFTIRGRQVLVDLAADTATYLGKQTAFAAQERDGRIYARVVHIVVVFSELTRSQMIYDPPSFSLYMPQHENLTMVLRTRRNSRGYQLVMDFSQNVKPPTLERAGSNLLLRVPSPELRIDTSQFVPDEAVLGFENFGTMPDGSTDVLLKLSNKVQRWQMDAFDFQNYRAVLTLTGDFEREEGETEATESPRDFGVRTIVLDPGHGGKDRGALGPTGLREKDVTLALCKLLRDRLEASGYSVKLTRDDDISLSLSSRTGFANHAKADLFVSVHVNAVKTDNARGSETYYLSLDGDAEAVDPHYNEEVLEQLDEDPAFGDVDDDLSLILWDMAQNKHTDDSFRVAKYIQEELNSLAGIRSRGVKQAPLKVLKGATMPAVLIEVAFITDPVEEKKLRDAEFQSRIVRALETAVGRFSEDVNRRVRKDEPSGLLIEKP